MAECECLDHCPFFRNTMASMPRTVGMIKAQYCTGPRAENSRCARYMVFAEFGPLGVPADLFPSQYGRALELIGE